MLQPLDVEHCLASLSKSIPTLQWWRFKLSKSDRQRHIWISLPANVEVVCGKTSLLPKNSQLLGRLNILHYGADCLIQGVRVTPSEEEQIVCIETRASEQDPRIFWIDVNQLAVVISPNGIQEILDISKPTLPLRGSHTWGWLSGLEVPSSKSQLITERCFLIPVDFSNRDDIAVLLSRNTKSDRLSLSESFSPSQKLIVVNPQTNKLYSCRLDSMRTSQTYSPFENMGSFSEVDGIKDSEKAVVSEDEEDGELAFPASMMDEEATKRDTKLSETLVEIEDFLGRVIWTIQHSSDGCVGRDTNVENQRCRIEMQLAEMQSCEEDLQIYESNASLSLLEKLLGILTCLLEISEMVNMHRRRDESSILRLVDQKLSDLTLWLDKSQSGEGSIPLPQARHALNQLACIQSAVRIFVGTAKPGVNLEATIEKVELWVGERLESEIHEKLAEGTPCQGISLKVGDVLTAFSESMKEHLPLLPTSVVSQLETPSTPLETLQLIRSNLAENMTFLKDRCGWIPCILSEGVQRKLNISQGLIADLRAIHNHAFTTYKQLEMYTPLVCEHSGLYALAVRLTNVLERSTDEKLSQWEISQLEQDLDRCEAECAVEILSSSKENREFITMVVRSLLEYTSVARKIVNGIYTIQEPQLSEWLERLNFLTSTSNRPCSSSFFEALLIGWYLQTRSFADSQMDELVCQLEQEVSASFQDTPLVHLRISEMEEFLSRTPPICTPCNAEASSLRSTLQILSDVILRLNSAVQLLERMAFLTNLHPSQRLKTLRFAYPRALEGLTRCFRALDALLRELAEWRKCIILVEDSDQRDTATQAVIEVVNFAMDVITQELQRVSTVEFFNAPDFLSQILAWLSSFHASLIGFRKAICQYRLEKSAICSHSSALLQDLLNLEWLITDSRLQSSRDMTRDVGGTAAGYIKTSWMASIQKILAEIEPTKRRRLLNLLEGMERSSRERRRSLLGLLLGSREPVKIFEGVTMLNYIVARTEGFTDLEVQALEEKYAGTEDYQSNGYEKPNSNVCEETFYTLMRNLSEEFRHIYNKQGGICDELKVAECLRKSEILVNIGRQCVATSRSSLHFINRVLFSHWPEALLKLITTGQLREGKNSPPDWRICALDFRNTVARCLVKGSFGFEKEGLPQVGTKVVDESLGNLRMAIEEADRIFHGIHDGFSVETEDVWQACLRLHDLFQSYTSQLRQQISDLTLPSLSAIKKDLQHLDGRLNKLAQDGSSPSALDDCSHSVAHLEESLQALRQTARILFTCLSTDSQPSSKVTPSKHLDVNELYRRAVKLVNDYEASEIGCQILEAWQQLQSIADKLGRLQAGLPLTESFTTYEAMTTQSPMTSTSDIHVDGFSSASMARKRSWSLLEILGSHECLYPGCRGKKSEKHEIQAMNDGLLHDLHSFYSLLCSEFHDRAMRIPVEVLTSSTQEAASSEIALLNLRQEWYRNVGLVNQFNSLHRRVKLDGSGRSEVRSSFALIEDIWGEATPLKAVFEATERLATVSSWLCEVERYLELDVLPRLQTAWKKSSEDDTLSVVEEYVYKMNEVAEDLEDLEKSGILAERHLKTVKHSLQAGWFSVREFLLNRCVEPAFHEDPTSVRYFPLVDDFLRHSVGLGFQDCDLKAIHTRLCNQYLFHGLPQREHHPVPGGRKFCSTHRSLRSLFLPAWLTERCRIVQHRPPVALTIHSIPDIYTEAYPPLSSTAELAFYSPNCIALQSQRWLSLPNIRSQSPTRREVKKNSFLMTEDELALNSPQPKLNEVEMKTSQPSFSVLPSEDERTEVEEKEEPTISEDPGNSALMRDVRLLLAQLKSQGSQMTQIMDVNGTDTKSEPNESEESKEEECSTILTPPECAVSKKVRDKSPITWCTVYLPNDEATELSAYPETVTERGVIRMASDPLLPKREPYAPMVFSAPHEASDQEGGEFTQEEVSGDVEGMVECSPSTTLDESGVCDWLQNQQGENIRRLMNEYGADEYDGDKADISLTAADNPSVASDRLDVLLPRTKSSVCDSFEESGFVDDEWLRRSHELPAHKTRDSIFVGDTEGHLLNQTKRGGVNWGPLVARPESPHLSVIAEVSADESGDGEWKTAAPKKTRSSSNRAAKKMDEEEEERTEGFTSPSPKIPTFWDSEDKHGAPTPTQTSFGAKDGIQPQEGDSEEEIDKTISEVLPLEVRVDGYESAASLQINMKSSSDSVGDPNTEVEEKEEPTISEDPGNSALMRDVRLLLAQLKSQGSQMTQIMDVNGTDTKSEPNESEESKEEECSTILTPPECAVSKKVRDKSPITWCTVYLPNDEATELSAYPETVTERGVIRMASDPLLPKREPYAPMVFSAPHEASDQEGGEFTQEEVSGDVEGMVECSPSTTLDESGVCDWLQNQQGENIRRLMNEYGADEYDGDKADISLTAADNPSVASDRLDVLLPRTKSSVCDSFEESGFVDDEWLRRSHELPAHKTRDSIFVGDTEGHLLNQTKRGGVNWGPLVARPESPHLSVIAEVSADESTLEKHQCFNEKLQKPSQVYEEEKHVGDGEWKTAAPKKTRSSSNRAAKKMDEEEEERTEGFTSPSPKIPTFWDSEDKHGAPTPTQTSFGAKDGIQPQEGDSEEEIDKTISEVLPLEVRVDGYESAASLQINMKSSSDSVGDPNTEVEEKEEPTISEDPGNSALMRDVRLLLAQLKSQGSQMTQIMDVNGTDTKSEPNESEESKEEECSTILTPPECAVSKKVRDKSPITWCTVYLPNDEATELSAYPETVTERGVIRMASDPLLPKREPYAPMVFSAPHEASDQEGGEFTEEVSGDVEGMVECSPSTTLDESGVCDWLQNQQGENIRRLMNEYGADEYDGDKADISLTAADDPSTASGLLEMPNPRTKNSICDSFEESGFADDEWLRRSHELPTQKTNNSLLSSGTNDFSFDEIKGGRVNWGPLVERPESPHLSVISEASTDGSTLEKQKCIDEKLQKSSQEVSEAEEPDDSSEWKTVAPKKTRSRSNRAAKKMGEEEEERTEEFTSFSLRIPTFWDSEDKHDAPTKTQTSLVVKDGIQPQEGDSDGETDKTISEVLPSEVRVNENESAKSLQKIMESSSDSVCGPNIKAEPFYEEMVEQGAELVDGNAIERQDTELCAAIKTFLQTTGKDENGFKEEPQSPEDGILEKTTFVEVGSEDVSEPRDEAEINLVQRDAGRDYRQRSQEVNFSVDERPPVEQTDTSEVNEQSGRGDFNSHLGKVGVNETNNEKISLNSTKSSTKPKRKLKKSRKKNSSEDPSTRVVSKPPSWNNVHRSAKFEGTDAITDGPSSTEQEVQILNEHKKGGNLLNGFQNAGKYDRGVATKPLAKKRKYRELINVREVSNSEGLPASKESGDVLSAVHAKFNHKAQIGVNIPEEEDNLFDSTVVDVDEGQFASEFIYDGLLVYDLQPDDEVKEEAKLKQKCNGGVEVEKAKTDTKDARSSLQKKNWVVKAAESLLEEVHPVDVDEPIDPAVLSSKLDHHQMDQHCIDEGVALKNKEVLLISSHLWEGEAKKGILHEVDLTKWSDEKDAKRGQSVEPIDDTKDDNTFIPTLKENACQDPEQSVALTTEMDKDRSCPEDANSTKKRKTKPKKGDRKERDLDRKSGNKEAVLSENLAVSDKVRVGNEAVSPANEFNAYVDKDGLEIKPKLQSDLSDLDEDLLRHLEENVHSGGRKIEIQGGDMDTLEETSTEDKGLESNGLGTVDTWNDLLSSKEFEIYSKEEKGKRITVKMDHLEGFGSRDVLRECTNEDAESQGHLAEARDSSDEIYQSGTIQRVDASSSSKAPEVPSIKGGKKKRHQRGRHIVSEVEVEECTTSTVPASREMSIIDAEVDHKASEVAAGVGHLMQPEEAKGALDIIGDGQVLVLETEKQPSTVLKEASKQIQHQHVAGKLNDQLEDESQVNECDPEAGGETVDELRAVAEANVMKNLNEGEEGEHLQYEHATEGVGGELQPQTSQDTMRWEDSEFQEHPVEGPDRLDEFDQSETIQRVDALSSPEVSEVPSIKSGKKKSKRHRKESHPFVVKVEAQTLDSSTVLPATVMADLNDEAELNITEAFVDEQEFASDLLKEPQPIHHEVVVKELPEHPEDRFQINDSKSDVQDESADESRAVGETSNLVSGYESKQHSAEQEKREKYFEEGGERTQDERDVEDGSDESQPRANEEALKMSTDEGVETPNDLIEGEGYVNEIVEPESNPIFGDLSASQEHEGISVRGEGKKRRRKERYFQDEGEVETLEATADVGYPLEPEDDTKTKNIATNGKEFASGGSEEVSQPSEHDLMEKETPGHLGDEAQSIKHKLEVQGMSADGSKPHLTEENEKNWDNEEREHWQGEGGNVGDEDELRPQENEDIWSETTDERDAKPFKRPTEGEDNVNKIADPATIQGVDTLSSSQESETPPVKSKTKKQHRKKKQLLSEVEMVVGVEPPIQTEEDKSALDVVVGRQGSVLGIGKHSQPNEQEFAVKESFIYLEGKPQTDECNLEVQRDLVNESRGIGEVDELLQLDECEPHLGQKEKERKHREEGKHWPGESEFEGVGDKSQVLTNEEDDEESCNSRLKVGDDIAEIVGAETPRTTDVLPSSQEPEGLSMKIGERSQHPEDSYLQNGTGAQKLETSTAFSLKELSGMVDEGEFETARTAVDEQRKEHHEEEEGEDLLNESNVEGVGDDLRPQTNKGILQECTKEDVESQKHPAQARYGSDKIDKFETTYGVVILSSPEESEASSMKGGKKKRHRKKRHLMNKAEVEECTASTVLASQEMSIMDAEADLKTPEAAPGVGYSLQSEEAKSASDIIVDGQEPVSDIEKQPIVILEGASPPIRHEFVENKSTDYPEDESQINECELVVEEELVNELKTVDKANDIEHFHVPRAHSEEQGKKKWHCNEGEKWQKKRGTDTIGSESQPQREAESPSQPTEGEDSLNVASKSEAIQDIGAMASSLEPETLSIRGEKGRKQRKKAFPQDEGVIQSAETVAEDENTLIITTEDGASSYGLLKKVTRSNVLKESSDCWEDVAQSRKYTLEDQNEIVDGSRAIDEADELEAHPGGQERMQIHGEVEHCLNKSGVGDADDVLQLQRNKETMREFTDEGEKTNKSPTKGGDNVELIVESEVVQGVEAVSRSQEPDPHSLKRGRRAKHRKGRHPNAEAEAQECVTSTVPAIQGMAGANDEADLKVSEVAADVGYLMQPEEGKCTLDVTVEEEKSASDALEEIPQSNEQELVEGKMEDGLHSNQFKWEILGMTVDEFKTVCQSDDLVHSHETDKKPWKQDEKLSHSEVGELWHDELCLEGVANATQPQTDARDLKDFTDEAAGSQENLRKGEIVASEAIPSVDTLPSSQKLGSPSINRKEKAEIEEESHQKGNSISSPEDQLSQKKGKTDLDSVVGGHLSTPQIYPDDQLKSNLDEFAGSDDLSNQHVKSDDEASQPRFEVREVPSHQGKKKPPRAEFSSDDYRDEKVSNLWTPSLPPPGSARETVTKDGLEIPGGRDDQFANCEPYSANSVGEKSQALDFATTEDLTVAVEYTHSPFMKNSPKVDNLPCLSQDLSHDSDEDPSQTDNTMENEETVAVIGRRSTQEEMPMSVDISEPLNGRTLKLKPSQESKESSKKKDKKRKHPKEKSPECGEPLEVVDVEIDERPPPEHESEAASTKCGKKKKKHQREKYLKNVHTAEEDSKSLSTETKVENHPADKVVLGGEHVQITSTAPTSREGSESFAEQVDKSNVPSVSLGTEGRSPVSKMEMELQKQPTAGSDVDRENEDGKKSNQEGYNLECNPELQNTEAEENLTENNLKQIESWKESELKECPGATTLETVGPNVTTSIPILGETKEDNQRAKELSRNSEAQGKDEKELELSRSPDVDANKEQDDQQLKEVDNPFVSMEEEGEISLEEFPGLNELEFCQNHREFGENSIDTGSKFHEANLSPNPDEEAIPVAVADEQAWKDEERLENRVGDVSDKYFELSLHPVKDVDVLEDLFVSKVSEASVNHSTSQKPPKSAMPRKESHQGSEITTLSDSTPSTVDVGIDDLQETESVKSIQKENKEEDFEESSSPHFYSSTAGDCSALVAEEEKEELPPYDSTYETEVYRPELICTGLPFPQELGGKAAEANRGKKKRWRKVSTTKDTEEYLTPAVEADEQPECVKPVDETLIPVDADTSQVVGADKDLVNKDISQQKDVGSASRELDSGGRVQGTVTGVKTEEAFSLEPNKRQEEKGKTAKGECSSTINPPEMSHLSNNGQRWPVNLQEMEREGTDVATDPQQSLGIEVPVEVIHPEMTSTPKGEDLLSSKSSTEIIQPSDVVTSSHPSSTRKKYVNKEPCVEVDIESGRQVENVEEAEEEEEDEGPVTSTDHSFTLIEQSPSDTDEVDDFTVVVKSPAPRTIIEAEAPAELITIPSESLQIRVKRRRLRWPCLFLLLLLFLLFFLIPTIIFFCITVPDFCFLPGPCPGLTLRQRINTYIHEFHRQRMPPFPT